MHEAKGEARISCAEPPSDELAARSGAIEPLGRRSSGHPPPGGRSRGRLLVVDDEANARAALAELLRGEGYTVETAADGFKALPKLEEFAPDLLLTDLKVPLLASRFLHKYAEENGKVVEGFSHDALATLTHHAWPGNVRELENAIERAVVICRGSEIQVTDLASHLIAARGGTHSDGMPVIPGASLADLERFAITKTLEHTGGSTSRAAEILGISPRTIQYRLQEYGKSKGAA
jgi:DNA-binding NtrC family response regulator